MWSIIFALISLPGMVGIFVPAAVLYLTKQPAAEAGLVSDNIFLFSAGLILAIMGLFLAVTTVRLFFKQGKGTPAPWDPPRKLVAAGPYRYVRNPMISGMMLILCGEALIFASWPLAVWAVVFFLGNNIYFILVEEKGLASRFGDDYLEYKKQVPRWLPRIKPWSK